MGDKKTDIVIVGYPKSGCTWLTRLVAELVGCPVAGFLGCDYDDVAREGQDRKSEFRCFKSHHPFHELENIHDPRRRKTIYVVRDPRDVVLSGAHFFFIARWSFLVRLFGICPHGREIYRKYVNFFVTPSRYRIEKMAHAVLHGSPEVNVWTGISWAEHCRPYVDGRCYIVRYEDLLDRPEDECKGILEYLALDRSDVQIRRAVERQSFARKKEEFQKNRDIRRARFLRSGSKGQWRRKLTPGQRELFLRMLKEDLGRFGYPTEDGC